MLMPCASPAPGRSPQMRSRRPKRVRHNNQALNGTIATAKTVIQDIVLTRPRRMPLMSETKNQCFLSNHPRTSGVFQPPSLPPARKGNVNRPTVGTRGDCVIEPPASLNCLAKTSDDMNRVNPGARMLMATPEITLSTPNCTVATACSTPPKAPPSAPMRTPHHAPNSSAPHAPNQVPSTIIPSRPMLTTPARSEKSPPRPANKMGTPQRNIALDEPSAVSRLVLSKPCTTLSTTTPTTAYSIHRAHAGMFFR